MTNSVGLVASPQPSAPTPAASAASTSAASSYTATSTTTSSSAASSSNTSAPILAHIVVDPLAGVITQFFSASGRLESQTPSVVAVAYLRAGLTAQGYAKPSPETQNDNAKQSAAQNSHGNSIIA